MQKHIKKIVIILMVFIFTIMAAVASFEYLANHGKFTAYIERQINKKIDGKIKIGSVFVDSVSRIVLNQITFQGSSNLEYLNLKCKSLTINYSFWELLNKHIEEIEIIDPEINVNLQSGNIGALTNPNIPLTTENILPQGLLVGDATINNITIQVSTDDYLTTLSRMNIQIHEIQSALPIDVSINGAVSILNRQNDDKNAKDISAEIDIKAKCSLKDDELNILDTSSLVINDIGSFKLGGIIHSLARKQELDCSLTAQKVLLDNIPDLIKYFDFADIEPITIHGETDIELHVLGNPEHLRLKSSSATKNLNVTYENVVFKVGELLIPAETEIFPFDPKGKITCKCQFDIANGQLWAYDKQIANLNLPVVFEMDYPEKMTVCSESIDGDMLLEPQRISLTELFSNIKIDLGLAPLDKMPFKVSIDTAISDPIHASGEYEYKNSIIMDTKIDVNNINFKALVKRFKAIIPDYYKDWSYKGNISIDTFLDAPDRDVPLKIAANTTVSFSDIKFHSPDYDYFGEKINGIVEIEVETDWDFMRFRTGTIGNFDPFLIQLGSFSTDMRSRKTAFHFNTDFDTGKSVLSGIDGALFWKDVGLFTIDGKVENLNNNPDLDLNLKISDLSNFDFFEIFVKDTVEYSSPTLFNTDIDGLTNTKLHILGPIDNMQIDGRLGITNTNIQCANVSVEEFSVAFPISIKYPNIKVKTVIQKSEIPDAQYGTIKIGKLMLDALQMNNLHFNPAIIANNFFIKEGLSIPVCGGTFDINDIFVDDIINADRKINFTFQLNDIDIEQASAAYGITPFEGFLNSSAITFKQQGNKLFSEGEIGLNVFGGDIVINNLVLSNLMSPLRGIGFSADVKNLDLEQMSNTFKEWGSVTGIVNGHIDNFKIVAGEPSNFDVELKTEKRKGVDQIVSSTFLKSFVPGVGSILNNLGITTFKYEVIGLEAKLENDYITFKGAVSEDGKELFMKGAGLKKLNIVFNNADKKTKFKNFLGSFGSMMDSNFNDTQVNIK